MVRARDTRRENFDVRPEQQAEIDLLQTVLQAPSKKDAILAAVRVTLWLVSECKKGHELIINTQQGPMAAKVILPGIEMPGISSWKYLVEVPHPWRRQLYVKGRKLPASTVWSGMIVNDLSREEAAKNWDLPREAVDEIITYCENNRQLIDMEADEEKRRLALKGIKVDSESARG